MGDVVPAPRAVPGMRVPIRVGTAAAGATDLSAMVGRWGALTGGPASVRRAAVRDGGAASPRPRAMLSGLRLEHAPVAGPFGHRRRGTRFAGLLQVGFGVLA